LIFRELLEIDGYFCEETKLTFPSLFVASFFLLLVDVVLIRLAHSAYHIAMVVLLFMLFTSIGGAFGSQFCMIIVVFC
jgi:hypothetical protein